MCRKSIAAGPCVYQSCFILDLCLTENWKFVLVCFLQKQIVYFGFILKSKISCFVTEKMVIFYVSYEKYPIHQNYID